MSALIKDTTHANNSTPLYATVGSVASLQTQVSQMTGVVDSTTVVNATVTATSGALVPLMTVPVAGAVLEPATYYLVYVPVSYTSSTAGPYSILATWTGISQFTSQQVVMNTTAPQDTNSLVFLLRTPLTAIPTPILNLFIIHDNGGSPTVSFAAGPYIGVKKF